MSFFLNKKMLSAVFALLVLSSAGFASSTTASTAESTSTPYRTGQVYTMRGGLLGVFSRGMALLSNTLETKYHIDAKTTVYHDSQGLSSYIIQHYKAGDLKGPIILVGHSLGANEQVEVAKDLALAHIPVELLITLDPGLPLKVPANVRQVLNFYQPTLMPVFKGVPLSVVDPKRTQLKNINLDELTEIHVNHFVISENPEIQKRMIAKILATLRLA